MKKLQEIIDRLLTTCTVGDTVTNRAAFECVAELQAIDSELEQDRRFPEQFERRPSGETLPHGTWVRELGITVGGADVPAFGLRLESLGEGPRYEKGSTKFVAVVYFSPDLAAWKTHVVMNGSLIHMSEHGERFEALEQARRAVVRAWDLRDPDIRA